MCSFGPCDLTPTDQRDGNPERCQNWPIAAWRCQNWPIAAWRCGWPRGGWTLGRKVESDAGVARRMQRAYGALARWLALRGAKPAVCE